MANKELKKNRKEGGKRVKKGGGRIRKEEEDQGWEDKTWREGLCHFACLIRSAVFLYGPFPKLFFF